MMDALIHRHLDTRLDIQEGASATVEKLVAGLNLDALISNPEKELARIAQEVMAKTSEIAQEAVDEGQRFAAEVKKRDKEDREVLFDGAGGPRDNKEEVDDRN